MLEAVSCGQALVRLLEQYGVDTVFGIPGTHTLELYRGLAHSRIRHIQPRHEQGAGFMADGYARASGRPGVCFLIAGPGLLNAATAIAQAYSDSVPVLVISSVASSTPDGISEGHIHELPEQAATMGSITGWSATAASASELPQLIERAFASFRRGRRRPVHIALPLDVMNGPASHFPRPQSVLEPDGLVDASCLAEAAELLGRAERPAIILGGGGSDCGDLVARLAERIGAVILTTIAAKGAPPAGHPLLGGALLTRPLGQATVRDCDVVLALGTELAASDTWTGPLEFRGRLIRVDIDRLSLKNSPPSALKIHADLRCFLPALLEALPRLDATEKRWAIETAATLRGEARQPSAPRQERHLRALDALRDAIPDDATVTADMAQVAYTANVAFPCPQPRSYFYPVGLSTMGYALPAAIGAKLAAPERAAIALTGDGGFLFTAAELGTAVELGLPIVVLLWNNDGLGQIRERMTSRNIPPIGVNPRNPDFLVLARAFGCRSARPASIGGLKREIRAALRRSVPTVIEIHDDGAWLA
jgi:5-guanidino-2-oxopentanoate decarboxylase